MNKREQCVGTIHTILTEKLRLLHSNLKWNELFKNMVVSIVFSNFQYYRQTIGILEYKKKNSFSNTNQLIGCWGQLIWRCMGSKTSSKNFFAEIDQNPFFIGIWNSNQNMNVTTKFNDQSDSSFRCEGTLFYFRKIGIHNQRLGSEKTIRWSVPWKEGLPKKFENTDRQ